MYKMNLIYFGDASYVFRRLAAAANETGKAPRIVITIYINRFERNTHDDDEVRSYFWFHLVHVCAGG